MGELGAVDDGTHDKAPHGGQSDAKSATDRHRGLMSRFRADRIELRRVRQEREVALRASRSARAHLRALRKGTATAAELAAARNDLKQKQRAYHETHQLFTTLRGRNQRDEQTIARLERRAAGEEFDGEDQSGIGEDPPASPLAESRTDHDRSNDTVVDLAGPRPTSEPPVFIDLTDGVFKRVAAPPSSESTAQPLMEATGVSKKFASSLRRSLALGFTDLAKLSVGRSLRSDELRRDEFWAVQDVDLALNRGEALGVLGSNGSGKSTLVRVLAGVLPPDTGEVTIRGRLTSVLTIGAGFHPHLTGRENIRVNAAILGIGSDEFAELEPEMIAFAGLGDRIEKPVGMYSTGMRMRLGFAVATAPNPDVMVFDEVLAVGDQSFKNRCQDRLAELHDRSAMVMVSQTPVMLAKFCSKAIWLDGGKVQAFGSIDEVGDAYLEASAKGEVS